MSGVKITIKNPPSGDPVELAHEFIYRGGWQVTQNNEEGDVGRSTVTFDDDPGGTLWTYLGYNVGGRQQIKFTDLTSNRITHFGFVGKRGIKRKYDDKGNPLGRAWSVDIWDPNCILERRILTHNGARRPRESDVDRINALFGFPEWGIIEQFMIGPSETTMSKHDYRGMTVRQYIADCAQASRKNYWVDIVDLGDGDRQTFWYGRDSRNEYASTLSISNDLADLDLAALDAGTSTTVYPPSKDTEYTIDPERVFDGIWASGEKHSVYRRRPATSDVLGLRWDTAMQWPTVHEKDRLIAKAESMLERLADEHEIITTSVEIPAAYQYLIRGGMRIPVKLTHIPRLASFTDCRILSRGAAPIYDGRRYRIPLTLEPIGASEAPLSCSTAVSSGASTDLGEQTGSSISFSVGSPNDGEDMVMVGGVVGCKRAVVDSLEPTGSMTELYGAEFPISNHPSFTSMYDAVAAASGSYDFTATWSPGGTAHWGGVGFAFQTSATTPENDEAFSDNVSATFIPTFTPTVGNLLVMVACSRDDFTITDTNPVGWWTKRAEATATDGISQDVIALFTHCVETGDDTELAALGAGIPGGGHVSISEWEVT